MSQSYLICTDLDRTLLPNGEQEESVGARECFKILAGFPDVLVGYVSGRDKNLVKQAIEAYDLPSPDYVVCDVGTTIYDLRKGSWENVNEWDQIISSDWNSKTHSSLACLLWDFEELYLQEWEKQNTYKLSYYVDLSIDRVALLDKMETRLYDAGVNANVIWSVDEEVDIGLLDIIPANATKKHAVEFLQSLTGVANESTLFAGDSGNDLPVLISQIPSVLVANSMDEVREEALSLASSLGLREKLYIANGNYLNMNGNYGSGILEGVSYYYPELASRLEKKAGINREENA